MLIKLFNIFLLTAFFVSAQDNTDNVFNLRLSDLGADVKIDTTAIPGAIVGVGIDYESMHRTNQIGGNVAVYVFGTDVRIKNDTADGWVRIEPVNPGGGAAPTPDCKSAGIFGAMPNLLIGLLMIWICSGRFNSLVIVLCVLVVFGSVSSVPPVTIVIYIPEDASAIKTLTVNANIVPMIAPKVKSSIPTVTCQVKGTAATCGSQVCTHTGTGPNTCLLEDAEYVGVLLPLSPANVAATGPIILDAINYYVDLDGFSIPYIQYIVADTHANPTDATTIVGEMYTKHNVTLYIGPITTDECINILNTYDNKVLLLSPAATSTDLAVYKTIISLSMSNTEYIQALNMIVERDFDNTLENVKLIHIGNSYGNNTKDIVGTYFDVKSITYHSYASAADIPTAVSDAAQEVTNNTAVVVIANSGSEVGTILAAAKGTSLTGYPWYTIGVSFNPALTTAASDALAVALQVQLKSLEFRGSNIEAHTADRTLFYETFCLKYGPAPASRPLPSSIALGFDAALLIANTPLIFDTTPLQGYFLLIEHGDVTFGLSGWLTMDDTGFRSNGDFICELVDNTNPLKDNWLELGYIELDRHKIFGEVYYEISYRVVTNYVIPGNWSTTCSTAQLGFLARTISRQYVNIISPDIDPSSQQDIAVPLYDTFFVQYNCDTSLVTQVCPSALYGSDTQCDILFETIGTIEQKRYIEETNENQAPPSKPPPRQVCSNAGSTAGCVSGGKAGSCGKANSTCAKAAFKDACTEGKGFC